MEWLPLYYRPRSVISTSKVFLTANTATQIVDLNENRESLIIASVWTGNGTDNMSFYFAQKDAVDATNGINQPANWKQQPWTLSKLLHGGMVTYPIWAYAADLFTVYVVESSYHVCQADLAKYLRELKETLSKY